MFRRVLIANRGEIACRVIRTCRRLGIRTAAVFSDADRDARHVALADEAHRIGPAEASASYLNIGAIVEAARTAGAEAVHPGYGFLAENADFAESCAAAGLVFVGPPPAVMRAMGRKDEARRLMARAGVPVLPGLDELPNEPETLVKAAAHLGLPLLVKAAAGGGGKGMRVVRELEDLGSAIEACRREAEHAFGDDALLIERYLEHARHIEVQILGDASGRVRHLFERECSLQRRHQKIVEEAPAPELDADVRTALVTAAITAGEAIGYVGAGTVEFLLAPSGTFYFMEMNARLQVEHPVTEMITGVDLVEAQLRIAAGLFPGPSFEVKATDGHAIEARLYAEDPARGFVPSAGRIGHLSLPAEAPDLRIETGIAAGDKVGVHYDPMLAKLVAWGPERESARRRLRAALADSLVTGLTTNLAFLERLLDEPDVVAGRLGTRLVEHRRGALCEASPVTEEDAAAMVFALLLERREEATARAAASIDPGSPWHRVNGWRLSGVGAEEIWHLAEGQRSIEARSRADGDGDVVVLGDRSFRGRAERVKGRIAIEVDGRRRTGAFAQDGLVLHLAFADRRVELRPVVPHQTATADAAGGGSVVAPMPGRVLRVFAARGDRVARGDGLVLLEAMKMEHRLDAPCAGRVVRVDITAGDQVEDGAVLVEIMPDGEEASS